MASTPVYPVTNGVTTLVSPPEGYVVDFNHPQSQHAIDHYLIFAIGGFLAFLTLVQRFYTKHFLSGGLGVDDGSISIGGLCHHVWEMPIEVYEKHMISSFIAAPVFILCNGLTKSSLLVFYLRISPQSWYVWTIRVTIAMVVTYTIIIASLLLGGCSPVKLNWDPYASGTCLNTAVLYMAIAVANITSDVILFLIPIPTLIRLKMRPALKIGAMLMFALNINEVHRTITTSIIRLVFLPALLSSTDIPWDAAPANIWAFVELNLFIICGSMPTLRKFFKAAMPKWLGSTNEDSKPNTYGTVQSKARQPRSQYSQFDDVEMDNFPHSHVRGGPEFQRTKIFIGNTHRGEETSVNASDRDDNSEKEILEGGKSIMQTRTIQIQYD
ncbi:hypothetical protein GQ53DRAFT_663278 [Thozetella sp. PMI_491]|nr:hypothetical protein GQ53DRAFT_663278 [Thozetella sp. PMI_491]